MTRGRPRPRLREAAPCTPTPEEGPRKEHQGRPRKEIPATRSPVDNPHGRCSGRVRARLKSQWIGLSAPRPVIQENSPRDVANGLTWWPERLGHASRQRCRGDAHRFRRHRSWRPPRESARTTSSRPQASGTPADASTGPPGRQTLPRKERRSVATAAQDVPAVEDGGTIGFAKGCRDGTWLRLNEALRAVVRTEEGRKVDPRVPRCWTARPCAPIRMGHGGLRRRQEDPGAQAPPPGGRDGTAAGCGGRTGRHAGTRRCSSPARTPAAGFRRLRKRWVDGGHRGPNFSGWVSQPAPGLDAEVVKRSDDVRGFRVRPRRWVVARTFDKPTDFSDAR